MHLFCFGLGYVARALIKELDLEWKFSASHTGKREAKHNEYIFNEFSRFNQEILKDVTHILISIPPTEAGDPVFKFYGDYIKSLPNLKWLGYISSTSVYGDHQGKWVCEQDLCNPSDAPGKNRLVAEKQWLESNLPINIIRLASIYGPERSPLEQIATGKAIRVFKENHYFSRIHIDDIVQLLKLIIQKPIEREIYNFADDHPAPSHEVIEYACNLLKVSPPKMINFQEANLSEAMKNYYLNSKRVDNKKIKSIYGYRFIFPSYKEGLISILEKKQVAAS